MGDLQRVLGVEVGLVERVDGHPRVDLVGGPVRRDEATVSVLPAVRLHPDRAEGLVLLSRAGGRGAGARGLLGIGVNRRLGPSGGGGGEEILGEIGGRHGPVVQRHFVLLAHLGLSHFSSGFTKKNSKSETENFYN